MDPLLNLNVKRLSTVSYELCIICQMSKNDQLFSATDKGLPTIREAANTRHKMRDSRYKDAIERINNAFDTDISKSLTWHKSCYAVFTDKGKIQRLQKNMADDKASSTVVSSAAEGEVRLRSSAQRINWKVCMFCQDETAEEKLSCVQTFETSNKILEYAKYHHMLRIRFALVNDLIASEGKYHPNCYKRFLKNSTKVTQDLQTSDLPMIWLCSELRLASGKGSCS